VLRVPLKLELPPDERKFIVVHPFPLDRLLQRVVGVGIRARMTMIAVLHAARLRGL